MQKQQPFGPTFGPVGSGLDEDQAEEEKAALKAPEVEMVMKTYPCPCGIYSCFRSPQRLGPKGIDDGGREEV